ncbi:MAG: hypothetical protein II346_09615, partial [Ruminococcus sp.]|nr:hypothetical protein [Ruminococcus sp.]
KPSSGDRKGLPYDVKEMLQMLKRNCSDRGEGFGAKEKTANLSSQLITDYKSDSKFKKSPARAGQQSCL